MDNILVDPILVDPILDPILDKFKYYRNSHPNLTNSWVAYLELKKKHYSEMDLSHGRSVLACIENGYPDLNRNDMIRVLLYSHSIAKA
jgi:hypothetical protein